MLVTFFKGIDPDSRQNVRIALVVSLRVIRVKHTPDHGSKSRSFAQMIRLARKYKHILAPRVRRDVLMLAHATLTRRPRLSYGATLMANALLEDYTLTFSWMGTTRNEATWTLQ